VELSLALAWRFGFAGPAQRCLYHMAVLTPAVTQEHRTGRLNASLLRGGLGRLRLPRALREMRHEHFPGLRPE
jgi:hypothetical protein